MRLGGDITDIMTRKQLADFLQVTEKTVDRMRKEGMPCFKVASNIRFNKEKVIEWLEQNRDATEEKSYSKININILPENKKSTREN